MAMMVDDQENSAYKEMYSRLYQIIYKCNMIVDKLNSGSDERKRVIGEAKAWRAWAMARLTQLWGSAPLVDHVLDGINYSFYPGNSDPEKNWEWIMQQFDEAAEVLPSKSGLGGQRAIGGRWTAEACYAFMREHPTVVPIWGIQHEWELDQWLALTEREAVLEISHMGFVTGLFDAVGAGETVRPRLLTCIRDKNRHELQKTAAAAGLSRQGTDALCRLGELAGPWEQVLSAAEPLALNAAMGEALTELRTLCEALDKTDGTANVKLDLSLVNDMEYYNGLVLQGYLAGLPRAVLRGGRYDPGKQPAQGKNIRV